MNMWPSEAVSKRYIVAVSGGVDSVVLLHQLVQRGEHELVVAHFDHGIRRDSFADARFVQALAARYGLPYVTQREELGAAASEALARRRRYAFLRQLAAERQAQIVTAHHQDDVVETVAINLIRGTGWRGLAVLAAADIARPLLGVSKAELLDYATTHQLEWVEDSTNASDAYLRNRVRRQLGQLPVGAAIAKQRRRQIALRQQIDDEVAAVLGQEADYARYLFVGVEPGVAQELLRAAIIRELPQGVTRPQLDSAVLAIKTARPGAIHQVGSGVRLRFTKRHFVVETVGTVVL